MKLNRSTIILLNVVLILFIAFLVKALISFPKEAYAAGKVEYLVYSTPYWTPSELTEQLNGFAQKGWKLHSAEAQGRTIIFER